MARKEMLDKSEMGKLIEETLRKGFLISEELEIKVWKRILKKTIEEKPNILNLKSLDKIKLPIEILERLESDYKTSAINLELDSTEFERRCAQTLKKGRNTTESNINSFLQKYKNRELRRVEAIEAIEQSTKIKFRKWDAEEHETEIIAKHLKNAL